MQHHPVKLLEDFLSMYQARVTLAMDLKKQHIQAALVVDASEIGKIVPDMRVRLMERSDILSCVPNTSPGLSGTLSLLDSCKDESVCFAVIFKNDSGAKDIICHTVNVHKTIDVMV